MKEIGIIPAKFKQKDEDFIVEEIGEKWECKISENFSGGIKEESLGKISLEEPREFLLCELEKKGLDHFNTIKEIAEAIHKSPDSIGYAGSKDKAAWTSQRISIFQPNLELLEEFSHSNIRLKNFKWGKRKIKIGYLEGNKFKITLRDLDKKEAVKIANKVRGLDSFPNYFGKQRFGTVRNNNVKIGIALFQKKFEKAVWHFLTDVGEENEITTRARLKLKSEKDFSEAKNYFPQNLRTEQIILNYLERNSQDFLGAIKIIRKKNLLMIVNAVQSHLFNQILERALEERIDFKKKGQQRIPLIGYKNNISQDRLGEIEQEVLAENGLKKEDFDLKEIPFLRLKGSYRNAIVEVKDLQVEISEDEMFEGSSKMVLGFTLPSGVYATTFLENFFDLKELKKDI